MLLVLTMACMGSLTAQAPETFKTRLSPVPVDAKTRADVTGVGSVTATLVGVKLSITGSFEGLRSQALDAKVHQGQATGVRGPAILDVSVPHATSGAVSATLDLTPQQIESLKKGRLYLQIDSEKLPTAICGAGFCAKWLMR
jgi:hypothetical protein